MYRFLVTASILVLLGFFYLGQRLVAPIWPSGIRLALWLILAGMIANLLWLPFKRWRRTATGGAIRPMDHWLTRLLEACAYSYMGFLSLLLAFSLFSEVLRVLFSLLPQTTQGDFLVLIPAGQNFDSVIALLVLALAILAFVAGRLMVATGPHYRFIKIVLPHTGKFRRRPRFRKKDHSEKKIRIAQISDLHIGRAIKKEYVAKVVSMVNAQNPDLICLTGDIGDGHASELRDDAAPLAQLQAKHGSWYIPGNHEYYWGLKTWIAEFSALGMHVIANKSKTLHTDAGTIFIAGTSDPTAARFAEELPKIPDRGESDIGILLVHQPVFARSAAAKNYDLMLAGHTHGGQYIPWSWVVHLVFRYARGLYRIANTLVYVNDGTGYWGAPLRIGTRPEITIMDVHITPGANNHA